MLMAINSLVGSAMAPRYRHVFCRADWSSAQWLALPYLLIDNGFEINSLDTYVVEADYSHRARLLEEENARAVKLGLCKLVVSPLVAQKQALSNVVNAIDEMATMPKKQAINLIFSLIDK